MGTSKLIKQIDFQGGKITEQPIEIDNFISEKSKLIRDQIKNNRDLFLIAPLGTGKTRNILEICISAKIPFVFAGPLRIIAEQNIRNVIESNDEVILMITKTIERGSIPNYKILVNPSKISDYQKKHKKPISIITIYDNVSKLKESNLDLNKYVLIIDEIHMLITAHSYRSKAINSMISMFYFFDKRIYLTGTPQALFYFEEYKTLKFRKTNPTINIPNLFLVDRKEFGKLEPPHIIANIILGLKYRKIIIYINNLKTILTVKTILLHRGIEEEKIKILHSKTKETEFHKHLIDKDILVEDANIIFTTDVISSGTNINNDDIDYCIIGNVDNLDQKLQFIGRFRKGIKKAVFDIVTFKPASEEFGEDFDFRSSFRKRYKIIRSKSAEIKKIGQPINYAKDDIELLKHNYQYHKELHKLFSSSPDYLKFYYEYHLQNQVITSGYAALSALLDPDKLISIDVYKRLPKSIWDTTKYYKANFSQLIAHTILDEPKNIVKNLLSIDQSFSYCLKKVDRLNEFEIEVIKSGFTSRNKEIRIIKSMFLLGVNKSIIGAAVNMNEDEAKNDILNRILRSFRWFFISDLLLENDQLGEWICKEFKNGSFDNILAKKIQDWIAVAYLLFDFNKRHETFKLNNFHEDPKFAHILPLELDLVKSNWLITSIFTSKGKQNHFYYETNKINQYRFTRKKWFSELLIFLKLHLGIETLDKPDSVEEIDKAINAILYSYEMMRNKIHENLIEELFSICIEEGIRDADFDRITASIELNILSYRVSAFQLMKE